MEVGEGDDEDDNEVDDEMEDLEEYAVTNEVARDVMDFEEQCGDGADIKEDADQVGGVPMVEEESEDMVDNGEQSGNGAKDVVNFEDADKVGDVPMVAVEKEDLEEFADTNEVVKENVVEDDVHHEAAVEDAKDVVNFEGADKIGEVPMVAVKNEDLE